MGGYYADTEQRCQVYHVCLQVGPMWGTLLSVVSILQDTDSGLYPVSFLCPNGTLFNQEVFVCDWW